MDRGINPQAFFFLNFQGHPNYHGIDTFHLTNVYGKMQKQSS